MSYKTVYTCDKCGAESEARTFLAAVTGNITFHPTDNMGPTNFQTPRVELCRDCLACIGVLLPEPGTNWGQRRDAIINEPSTTEKFIEITKDLIQELIDERA